MRILPKNSTSHFVYANIVAKYNLIFKTHNNTTIIKGGPTMDKQNKSQNQYQNRQQNQNSQNKKQNQAENKKQN